MYTVWSWSMCTGTRVWWSVLTREHTGELVLKSIMWCAEWKCLDDALAMGQTAAKIKTKTRTQKLSNYATSRCKALGKAYTLYAWYIEGSSGQDKLNTFWEGISQNQLNTSVISNVRNNFKSNSHNKATGIEISASVCSSTLELSWQ